MKPQARVVGWAAPAGPWADGLVAAFDDGPFTFDDERVPVVGVVCRGAAYVEGVLRTDVAVDGDDATARLVEALRASRYCAGVRAVLLDGVAFGGFNVVDLDGLHDALGVPVLAVSRGVPDLDAMEAALRGHVDGAGRKVALLRRHPPRLLETAGQPVAWRAVGLDDAEVPGLLAATTLRGLVPEPLRLAHLFATALVRGESRGL